MILVPENKFYVYMYLREDGSPYYVGKGCGRRAFNRHSGFYPPSDKNRIVFPERHIDEFEAFRLEIFWISFYGRKDLGTGILHNKTNGGGAPANFSKKTKLKISEKLRGNTNNLGNTLKKSTKEKISTALKGNKNRAGTVQSESAKKKMGDIHRGKILTEEHKKKISESKKGRPGPNLGKKRSKETTEKIILARQGLRYKTKVVYCPHCNKSGGGGAMKQWHFDNCKFKEIS